MAAPHLFDERMIGGSVLQVKELALTSHHFVQTLPCGHLQPLPLACSPECTNSRFWFRSSEVLRCITQAGSLYETDPGWSANRKLSRNGLRGSWPDWCQTLILVMEHFRDDGEDYTLARCNPNHLRRSYHVFSSLNPETQSMVSTICSVYL